ncbi:MAG TPA: hypothetical protein VFW11_14845 [Cyclobacteriaceae bacterium]|nr:hypothetical protein [Cyclobacteriaceae bacterium]
MKINTLLFATVLLGACSRKSGELNKVRAVDLNAIHAVEFSKEEWFVPYYLSHFSTVANSLIDTGANRGYINVVVWRTPDVNKPYNARIMENILSLAWFYTTDRPWNPYYNDPALRNQVEAALTFWCNIQNDDGRFSEYAPGRWSLAPTAFATKFVGRALYLLEHGPPIDDDVLTRANASLRKALYISFTDSALWEHGRNFTNQYANLWGGAMMYLQYHPDQTIDQLLTNRLNDSMEEFQSPCGYFYEKNGPDWGYNLSTHHSDLQVAWNFAKGTRLQDYFVEKTARWYDWFSYNAVKEPGLARHYLNRAVETRQQKWFIDTDTLEDPRSSRWTPQAEFVPAARAFTLSAEEYEAAVGERYDRMKERYPGVDALQTGEFWSFSPYAFLHDGLNRWLPTQEQKDEAVANLPYLKSDNFIEVRSDRRNDTQYSFVRKPAYYAIFNSGKIITEQQRYGLGLVWSPQMGTVLQSQSKSDLAAWGTRGAGQDQVYEASDVRATFVVNKQTWVPAPGSNAIEGSFSLSYPLGSSGEKSIQFTEDGVEVDVHHRGALVEVIPLLVDQGDQLHVDDNAIILQSDKGSMIIRVETPAKVSINGQVVDTHGGKPCRVIEIKSKDRLKYIIRLSSNP